MKTTIQLVLALLCAGCATQLPEFSEINRIHYSYYERLRDPVSEIDQGVALTIWFFKKSPPAMHYASWPHQVFSARGTNLVFMSEQFRCEVSTNDLQELYGRLRKGCLQQLPADEDPGQRYYFGWLTLETDTLEDWGRWYFRDTPRTKQRQELHDQLVRFVEKQIEKHPDGLEVSHVRLQGDDQPVVAVTLRELIQHPEAYDGKRVRVSGYHHAEFEHRSLSPGPNRIRDYDHSIWLGGVSGRVKPAAVPYTNDTYMTVEGTFTGHRVGHLGLWPGEVDRLTRIEIRGEKPGVDQPPAGDVLKAAPEE